VTDGTPKAQMIAATAMQRGGSRLMLQGGRSY
jgi:hypothetical protein